jgi:hypothetical protein
MSFVIDYIILYNARGILEFQGLVYTKQFNNWVNINKYNVGDVFLDIVKCFKNCSTNKMER